ncbi:MAG: ABC transporter ATP-binding protein [Bacteroidales bacterium]|jgi:subfamily B ATP-binding cassette protein MsbA|nr:ABC transporter ATP-binding protein [Bacteroidales bacterium]
MKDILRIFKYILPYKWAAIGNVFFNLLSTIFTLFSFGLVIPFLNVLFGQQELVTEMQPWSMNSNVLLHNFKFWLSGIIIEHGELKALVMLGVLVSVATLGKTATWYFANFFIVPVRNGVVRDIRNSLYKKILALHIGYFSEEKRGNIIARMTNDVQEIDFSIMSSMTMLFRDPIKIIAFVTALFALNYKLTLFVLLILPIAGLIIGRIGKSLRRRSQDGQRRMGHLMTLIEETVFGLQIIKAFNAEKHQDDRFRDVNQGYTNVQNKINRRRALASPITEFLATVTIVFVMWYGGRIILVEGGLDPAALISYLLIFSQVITPSKSLSTALYNVQKGLASVDRINEILKAKNKIKDPKNPVPKPNFQEKIEYKNVSFAYGDTLVLKDINLQIDYGKTIALIGQSGSGKTTIADLLPRFYDLTIGEITIDGVDIRNLKLIDLRSMIGYVNQSPILFNDSFANNIRFGAENVTQEDIIAAAKIAHAHDFIMEYEHGYDTNIGDGGGKLSGGQRQRLSIARAILKNPPIMILDEATSALDTESEQLVQEALDNLMKNRTSIVIAHRLSTIKNADLICVMQYGEIVEQGKHEELIDQNGIYTKLYNMQIK